jgi:hypothetical protein
VWAAPSPARLPRSSGPADPLARAGGSGACAFPP